jgi:hypothetical protein
MACRDAVRDPCEFASARCDGIFGGTYFTRVMHLNGVDSAQAPPKRTTYYYITEIQPRPGNFQPWTGNSFPTPNLLPRSVCHVLRGPPRSPPPAGGDHFSAQRAHRPTRQAQIPAGQRPPVQRCRRQRRRRTQRRDLSSDPRGGGRPRTAFRRTDRPARRPAWEPDCARQGPA